MGPQLARGLGLRAEVGVTSAPNTTTAMPRNRRLPARRVRSDTWRKSQFEIAISRISFSISFAYQQSAGVRFVFRKGG